MRMFGKSSRHLPGVPIGKMGLPDRGNGLAGHVEVYEMRIFPISITLIIRKTRTTWSMTVRVTFIRKNQ